MSVAARARLAGPRMSASAQIRSFSAASTIGASPDPVLSPWGLSPHVGDAGMRPHRGHVVAPDLEEVAPRGAGILVEGQVERRPGADALGCVTGHTSPVYGRVFGSIAGEIRQQPRRHRVRDLRDLEVVVVDRGPKIGRAHV